MPKFYEKRRQKYYAVLDVPKAFREQLGVSRRFVKSLQTDSESIASIRLNFVPVAGHWGTLPQSVKGAPNGTTSTQLYRRL